MRLLIALLLVAAACGESNAESCGFEGSTFVVHVSRLSGECPELDDLLVTPGSHPADCRESVDYTDFCEVTWSRSCLVNGDRVNMLWQLAPIGPRFAGTVQMSLASSRINLSCMSIYTARFAEL
jgi:hypothetical protein